MRGFIRHIWGNIIRCFTGYNFLFHLLAAGLTWLLAVSGLDWAYFNFFQHTLWYKLLFPAAILGGLLPILAPLALYAAGRIKKNSALLLAAFASGQAAIIGSLISSFYKALTGRMPPQMWEVAATGDVSRVFRFGFFRGGIFWGWPSSHATIAFAMAAALGVVFRNKWVRYPVILYAIYVAFGVSATIHWLSDALSGVILGTVIGIAVGRSFRQAPEYT